VPAEIVRLLKLVNVAAGKVFAVPNTTVPVPGVQVCVPVPGAVSVPLIVSVPPDVMVIVDAELVVLFPIARFVHVKVDPLWNSIVPPALGEDGAPIWTGPETVNAGFPLVTNPSIPGEAEPPKVKEAQTAFVMSTVTVYPLSRVTASLVVGTLAPAVPPEEAAHVLVEFQLPVAIA
jgi:hypothetical protein